MKDNTYVGYSGYKVTRDDAVLIKDLEVGKRYYVHNGLWEFKVIAIEETRVLTRYAGCEGWINKDDDDRWLLTLIE